MSEINVGSLAPDFSLPAADGSMVQLSQYRGKKVVLFFYSKDNTPGCSNEVRQFGEVYDELVASGAIVLGVSRDSVKTHEKFSVKLELPYLLLSDVDREVCRAYALRKVKVDHHAKEVLTLLKT